MPFQHVLYLRHIWMLRKIVRDYFIAVHIQNRRNITFAPRQIELRYIGCPLLQRFFGIEISIDDIISNFTNIAFIGMVFFLGTFSKQCKLIHDSLDTLVIYSKTSIQKLLMYAPYTISLFVLVEDNNNFG